MRVALTEAALEDLDNVIIFIARDNPSRAVSFGEELLDAAEAIGDLPLGHALVPGYERIGVRRKVHRAYGIFYWLVEDRIDVLHILNAAQNYEAILSEEIGDPE